MQVFAVVSVVQHGGSITPLFVESDKVAVTYKVEAGCSEGDAELGRHDGQASLAPSVLTAHKHAETYWLKSHAHRSLLVNGLIALAASQREE